jgi:hypothetical protein
MVYTVMMNNKGFSILNVLIIGSILSAMTVNVFQRQELSKRSTSSNDIQEELNRVTSMVSQVLANSRACTGHFLTNHLRPFYADSTLSQRNLTSGIILSSPYGRLISPNQNWGVKTSTLTVDSITLNKISNETSRIDFYFRVNDENSFLHYTSQNNKRVLRSVDLTISRDSNGIIDGCFVDSDELISDAIERFCQGPGAIFDRNSYECRVIVPQMVNCPVGQILVGLDLDNSDPSAPKVVPHCTSSYAGNTDLSCPTNQVLRGIDVNGDAICENLTANDLSHLIAANQKFPSTSGFENCASNRMRFNVQAGSIELECDPVSTPPPAPTIANICINVRYDNCEDFPNYPTFGGKQYLRFNITEFFGTTTSVRSSRVRQISHRWSHISGGTCRQTGTYWVPSSSSPLQGAIGNNYEITPITQVGGTPIPAWRTYYTTGIGPSTQHFVGPYLCQLETGSSPLSGTFQDRPGSCDVDIRLLCNVP